MLKKLQVLAAALRERRFTIAGLAAASGVPESTVYTVLQRVPERWIKNTVTATTARRRGGQPRRYELTSEGIAGIQAEIGRLPTAGSLAPLSQTSEPIGLLSARNSIQQIEVSHPASVVALREDALRSLEWAEAEISDGGFAADANTLLKEIAELRVLLKSVDSAPEDEEDVESGQSMRQERRRQEIATRLELLAAQFRPNSPSNARLSPRAGGRVFIGSAAPSQESFAQLFEQALANQRIRPGMILTGLVVEVTDEIVIVNVGLKSEAVIPIEQFKNERGEVEVKPGDEVEVALDSVEDGTDETRLSREKAKRARTWTRLETAFKNSEIVTGIIIGRVKGGFTVEIDNVRAFLPGSLLDVNPVHDTSYLENKPLEFKIVKLDQRRNNVVVSRRAVVEQEFSADHSALMDVVREGALVRGTVKQLTNYGAFVDLGGVDGLLHITDMTWRRIKHPSEVVKVGDEIDVRILKFDRARSRISLGLKQLGADPWENISRRYPPHTRVFGKVTTIADYGAFVDIEEGVEGLVHVSDMDWTKKNVNPAEIVRTGEEVEVTVLDVDEERRRISLGIKQCKANPWTEFAENYNRGDKVLGPIKTVTDFGFFIGLPGNIEGLVHLSDISWELPGEEAVHNYQKGQQVEVMVLSIDAARERVSLGMKQLAKDPFAIYVAENPRGTVVRGVVREVEARGAVIDLGNGIEGLLHAVELRRDRVEDARMVLKVGEEIEAKFIGVDRRSRTILLSIKAKEVHEEQDAVQSYRSETSASGMSLGDLLKEQIGSDRD